MKEITCPKCGTVITIDDATFSEILSQVKMDVVNEEVERRLAAQRKLQEAEAEVLRTLDAFAGRDLADREGGVESAVADSNHDAFIDLDAGVVAVLDVHGNGNGVAGPELGELLVKTGDFFLLKDFDDVLCHFKFSSHHCGIRDWLLVAAVG